MSNGITPFEEIRRTNPAGNEFWSSRYFAKVLSYADFRNFQSVIESARTACFNSGQRVEDHFVDVTDMIAPCPDHHWHVSKLLDPRRSNGEKELSALSGQVLLLPQDEAFHPDAEGLRWRCERLSA